MRMTREQMQKALERAESRKRSDCNIQRAQGDRDTSRYLTMLRNCA